VAKLPIVLDDSIATACTDGDRILYNPKCFDEFHAEEPDIHVTVLCEEVGHCLLGHLWRAPSGADWQLWNKACDQEVRWMMKDFGEQVKSKRMANPFPFPKSGDFDPDPQFRGMCAEDVYARLVSNQSGQGGQKPNPVAGQAKGASGAPQPGQSGGKGQSPGKSSPSASGGQPATFAEMVPPKRDAAGQKQQKTEWDATLMQSVAACKGRGTLPGSLSRFVDELLNPKVPWVELLKTFLRERVTDDWSWRVPNQYFDESDFVLPSLDSERMGEVVFAVDTSGSIDRDLLATFKTEAQSCLDEMKPTKLVELCCDTRITCERVYRLGDKIALDAPGGGGTSFAPVLRKCATMDRPPKCVVYLTDADGALDGITSVEFPILWVVYNSEKVMPFGETVHV
jgi:predicted metal-dependent peptidase